MLRHIVSGSEMIWLVSLSWAVLRAAVRCEMNGFFYTSVVLRRNECGCLHVHGAAVLGTDLFTWDTAPFADGAVLRGL